MHNIFENIADSYDIMNDVMSMGIHRIWKDVFMQELGPTHGTYLLDSAGGTGDITFRYINFLKNTPNPHNVRSHVTVCDINQHMLDVGKKRAGSLGLSQDSNYDIVWKQEDAEKLSFPDDSFSAYTIAFGIRNVTHIDKVLILGLSFRQLVICTKILKTIIWNLYLLIFKEYPLHVLS